MKNYYVNNDLVKKEISHSKQDKLLKTLSNKQLANLVNHIKGNKRLKLLIINKCMNEEPSVLFNCINKLSLEQIIDLIKIENPYLYFKGYNRYVIQKYEKIKELDPYLLLWKLQNN